MTVYRLIGEKIRARRKELKLTQLSVAEKVGIHSSLLCRMEKGQRKIPVDQMLKICVTLGIDLSEVPKWNL